MVEKGHMSFNEPAFWTSGPHLHLIRLDANLLLYWDKAYITVFMKLGIILVKSLEWNGCGPLLYPGQWRVGEFRSVWFRPGLPFTFLFVLGQCPEVLQVVLVRPLVVGLEAMASHRQVN